MLYDGDGRFLGFSAESDPGLVREAVELKGELLRRSVPLRQFLRELRGLV